MKHNRNLLTDVWGYLKAIFLEGWRRLLTFFDILGIFLFLYLKPAEYLVQHEWAARRIGAFIFLSAFVLANFIVYRKQALKIAELENNQPRISVGFQGKTRNLVKTFRFNFRSLPSKLSLEALVEDKRVEWFGKFRRAQLESSLDLAPSTVAEPDFLEELEQYLINYRDWLLKKYERTTDRARRLVPIIENQGTLPVNNITLEFVLPTPLKRAEIEQIQDMLEAAREMEEHLSDEELENLLFPPPPEPALTTRDQSLLSRLVVPSAFSSFPEPPPTQLSNTEGPKYEERDGEGYFVYNVEKLIQGRQEDGFEPLWVWFGNVDRSDTYEVLVRVYVEDPPMQETQHLLLEIGIADSEPSTTDDGRFCV
jgi:hypothetical protein